MCKQWFGSGSPVQLQAVGSRMPFGRGGAGGLLFPLLCEPLPGVPCSGLPAAEASMSSEEVLPPQELIQPGDRA